MSLLLDARKKSQRTCPARSDDSGVDEHNLLAAKPPVKSVMAGSIKRKLAIALSGTLLAGGTGYLIQSSQVDTGQAPRHSTTMPRYSGATAKPLIRNVSAPAIVTAHNAENSQPKRLIRAALTVANEQTSHNNRPIRIEQHKSEVLDPLLSDAYRAYRSGKLDTAQQLYSAMLAKDAHNIDSLLGLAVIAQQRGEEILAARYYIRVLRLDPRNAAANAGISSLNTDEHNESHLKTLLDEQNDSAALHFALGNHYSGQSRWGEAQQSYFSAYTLESDNAQFAFNLAISLDHLGEHKLAAQHYRQALQLDQAGVLDHPKIEQRLHELIR